MFNRKLLSVLAYVVAVLLLVKALLAVVMFAWAYVGTPPVVMFPPDIAEHLKYLLLIQELGTVAFIYLVLAALKNLSSCACHVSVAEKARNIMEAPIKTMKRVTRRATKK